MIIFHYHLVLQWLEAVGARATIPRLLKLEKLADKGMLLEEVDPSE